MQGGLVSVRDVIVTGVALAFALLSVFLLNYIGRHVRQETRENIAIWTTVRVIIVVVLVVILGLGGLVGWLVTRK